MVRCILILTLISLIIGTRTQSSAVVEANFQNSTESCIRWGSLVSTLLRRSSPEEPPGQIGGSIVELAPYTGFYFLLPKKEGCTSSWTFSQSPGCWELFTSSASSKRNSVESWSSFPGSTINLGKARCRKRRSAETEISMTGGKSQKLPPWLALSQNNVSTERDHRRYRGEEKGGRRRVIKKKRVKTIQHYDQKFS